MTGAEALQKIIDDIDELKKMVIELATSISLIQSNIKFLNNRAAGLMRAEQPEQKTIPSVQPEPIQNNSENVVLPIIGQQPQSIQSKPNNVIYDETPGTFTYKKVYGRLFSGPQTPISEVLIRIFDKNNEVCATTETDPAGYWETLIRPGRYSASYTKSGMREINKAFELKPDMKTLEVT
jgi:hypothetical protein